MRVAKRWLTSDAGRRALCFVIALYVRLVHLTSRWTTVGAEHPDALAAQKRPFIVAFWHGRMLMLPLMWARRAPLYMLMSGHRDGRIIAGAVAYFGIGSIEGSTTTGGGGALRAMLRHSRAGASVGITPDGPNGPAMRASEGIVAAARLAAVPIVPMTYATSRRHIAATWDSFHVALPFSRGVYLWGEPIEVPAELDQDGVEEWRRRIERRLNELTAEADRRVGREAVRPGTLARHEWRAARRAAGQGR
jgi:lysophospholipid acyltransferase (LPLAT)-like uncharacterized protein